MNIIFLDVDGVLNSTNNLVEVSKRNKRPYSGYDYPFDMICILNLVYLVIFTDSRIVITSTWRKDEIGKNVLLNELRKYDLDNRVIGYTRILHNREEEIKDYLRSMDIPIRFIILDDDSDFDELKDYLIQTDYHTGLSFDDAEEGIKRLTDCKKK